MSRFAQDLLAVVKRKKSLIDVWHYLVGNYRYKLYYAPVLYLKLGNYLQKLIRQHIHEQINYRIKWMDKDCLNNGECKICGCQTTHLQMCNKSCDKPCYPPMMTKSEWKRFNGKAGIYYDGKIIREPSNPDWHAFERVWLKESQTGRPLLLKYQIGNGYVQIN